MKKSESTKRFFTPVWAGPLMAVGLASLSCGALAGSCGRVDTSRVMPRTEHLFPARLIAVDGHLPGTTVQRSFRLSPGAHILTVGEIIDYKEFLGAAQALRSRSRQSNDRQLKINVEPDKTYLLAARLDSDSAGAVAAGTYWQPVIWKAVDEACD